MSRERSREEGLIGMVCGERGKLGEMAIQSSGGGCTEEETVAGLGRDRFRIGVLFNVYQKVRSRIEVLFRGGNRSL
jgi:hypothetical protein